MILLTIVLLWLTPMVKYKIAFVILNNNLSNINYKSCSVVLTGYGIFNQVELGNSLN